jgi:hypothetical protein
VNEVSKQPHVAWFMKKTIADRVKHIDNSLNHALRLYSGCHEQSKNWVRISFERKYSKRGSKGGPVLAAAG